MNKEFLKQVEISKESIDWWREQAISTAFEAEELGFRYEIGELTEEELLKKTKELDGKIEYLMAKGNFENKTLFEAFAEIKNEES